MIPPIVDTTIYKPAGLQRDLVTSIISKDTHRKGLDRLLEVKKEIPELVIIGLERKIPEDELIKTLRRTQFYLQPSRYESFGIAVIEAIATGCIPITSDVVGCRKYVEKAGYVVKDGDPKQTVEIIRNHWNDRPSPPVDLSEFTPQAHTEMFRHLIEMLSQKLSEG